MKQDILGSALLDYQHGNHDGDIKTYSSLEEEDILPLSYMFRSFDEMPIIEQKALKNCKGKVLDIGCGAGSHGLYLQQKGIEATALDSSPGAIKVCQERGLTHTVLENILDFDGQTFDTLLLLMNGIGLAGNLKGLEPFFSKLKALLNTNGQILLDSSDIIYMFENDEDGGYWIPDDVEYYGEVTFTMEYKKRKSEPFSWLYVDYNTLQRAAQYHGFSCELLHEGDHYDYLARLSPIT